MATMPWASRLDGSRNKSDERVPQLPLDMETPVDTGMVLYVAVPIWSRFPEAPSLFAEEIELLKAREVWQISAQYIDP